ncbi:tryptophan-rich sensory protein [Brachybacterium sp. J153]|uniref:tryptophan-rich sensory protein n=1 Tax=Brachybacterium sp. J153 TaxID=3116488 RepID=UPI002E7A6388|nr:tryptophan-rich sensory protein [Brachybacterium sp. J153]MEE1618572.1 tryptophan-rich sensory protein [Brachybacterium sp. J153]
MTPVVRHLAVTLAFAAAMLGTAVGVGVLGGDPIDEAAGGLLSADATHLAPAAPAFRIWSVIYAGLAAYTLWQWRDARDPRRIAALAIASLLLNAAWILVVQAGWVWVSVLVILALLAVLAVLFRRLVLRPAQGVLERVVVDGTFGLYLGWVSVATCANIAAALAGAGVDGFGVPGVLAIAVILVVGVIALALIGVGRSRTGRAPLAAPAAMVWGLAWIAVGRATDAPHAPAVAAVAAVVAALIAAAAVVQAVRRPDPSRVARAAVGTRSTADGATR